jgi:hypothetical protein
VIKEEREMIEAFVMIVALVVYAWGAVWLLRRAAQADRRHTADQIRAMRGRRSQMALVRRQAERAE